MKTQAIVVLALACAMTGQAVAQPQVWHRSVNQASVDVRGAPVVLARIGACANDAGTFVATFDGSCLTSPGDDVVLAASDHADWSLDDGNVRVSALDADIRGCSFSHTRAYAVEPGNHEFFAVAENTLNEQGTGIASIYGSFTLRFYPDDGGALVETVGITRPEVDVRGQPVVVAERSLSIPALGTVLVRFDGKAHASPGDRLVLAASNAPDWTLDDGHVSFEAFDASHDVASFSHSRVYGVLPGTHTFYGVVQNYVETEGDGLAAIYGTLTVEYRPETPQGTCVFHRPIARYYTDLRSAPVSLAQVTCDAPQRGRAVVHFSGTCCPSVGDRIVLAASDDVDWSANDGAVAVEIPNDDVDQACFSHTRVYEIESGAHTFHAVAQNFLEEEGTGEAWIHGNLTVAYFPYGSTSVVPTLVQSHAAVARAGFNELSWTLKGSDPLMAFTVERICRGTSSLVSVECERDGVRYVVCDGEIAPGVEYRYRVHGESRGASFLLFETTPLVAIGASVRLLPPTPNPFNPKTTLRFELDRASSVSLRVFDVAGRRVVTLIDATMLRAGPHSIEWNGRDDRGVALASGVYVVRLRAGEILRTRRVSLVQ